MIDMNRTTACISGPVAILLFSIVIIFEWRVSYRLEIREAG